ncbi:MAG: T9SS type A sorting domain-containing protein [Bacteroidota bacterium]
MQKNCWLLLIFLLLPHIAIAQTGNCEPAFAEAYLDAGNVRARILNNGSLFWRGSPHVYEVPKGENTHAIFTAGIWVGGLVNGSLRTAASRYGPWEFWAGPLDEKGYPPTDCKPYDHIWEIRTEDIQTFLKDNSISNNLKNWPWQLGAPVVDGDGNPDNYNLENGDLPELIGDQRLWWVMNDRGNIHEATDSDPIGIEVHGSAFSYANAGALGNVTFYEYSIINKNTVEVEDTYVGLFTDVDLGDFDDDYIGSDSLLHLSFAYNADNNDEEERNGYGIAPPAVGFTFLETIEAPHDGIDNNRNGVIDEPGEKIGTYAVKSYNSSGSGDGDGDPVTARDYYRTMQGIWKDGLPQVEWGTGREGVPESKITRFLFSGDPVTRSFWSELNWNGAGGTIDPADRRMVTSTGPFTIASSDTATIRFAIIWSRGKDHLDSITELRKDTRAVRSSTKTLYTPLGQVNFEQAQIPPPNFVLGFDQNFPNPFTHSTTLRYSLPQPMQVRLAVYDMLGREVALLVEAQQEAGIYTAAFDAGNLPAGIYLARIELDFLQFTKRMALIR